MKILYRIIVVVFFLLVYHLLLYSQNEVKVVYKEWSLSDTLYSIRNDNFKQIQGFYYPAFDYFDTIRHTGINPIKKLKINDLGGDNRIFEGWHRFFDTPIKVDEFTIIYYRIFLDSTEDYTIFLYSEIDNCWYKKTQEVDYFKYQIPSFLKLDQFENIRTGQQLISDSSKTNIISQLILKVRPSSKKFKFSIGDFGIYTLKEVEHPCYDPLFESINNINSLEHCKYNSFSHIANSSLLLSSYNLYNPGGNENFIVCEDTAKDEINNIKMQMISSIFQHYPFYKERKISKDSVIKEFLKIAKYDPEQFWDSLNVLVKQFHDPHFFVEPKSIRHDNETKISNEKLIDPARAYEINGDFYIAAVFDTTLHDKIFIGDKIIAVNGNTVGRALYNLEDRFLGTETARRQKSISHLLKGNQGDTLSLSLIRNQKDTLYYKFCYNSKSIIIPSDYKPKHCEFKKYKDVSYFRINLFTPDTWIRFLNHAIEIQNSKGIIFDIRNNGGGDLETVLNIFSTFIDHPCIVMDYESTVLSHFKETCVVKQNETYHFNLPVMILINKGTVCGSELFAYLMRKFDRAILIGDSESGGAFSERISIVFPDTTRIYTNAHAKFSFYPKYSIECSGVTPDIWVTKNRVEDLYPYEDKIKKTALELINYQ